MEDAKLIYGRETVSQFLADDAGFLAVKVSYSWKL
jgi:hypothetical protein